MDKAKLIKEISKEEADILNEFSEEMDLKLKKFNYEFSIANTSDKQKFKLIIKGIR